MKHIATLILFAFCATKMFAQSAEIIEIQSLSPPETKINFGEGDKNIAIVAIHYYQNTNTHTAEELLSDSLLVNTIANSVKETFEDSPMFENFDVPIFNLYSDTAMIGMSMPKEDLDAISEQSGAKIVVALEFVDIKSNYIFEKNIKRPLVTNVDFNVTINAYDAQTGENVMQYIRKSNVIIPAFYDDDGNYVAPPQKEEAKKVTAETIGRDYAKRIIPTWETVERLIFYDTYYDKRNSNLNKAYNSAVIHQDWSAAAQYWTDAIVENSTKSKKAQVMYNLAVACEMLEKFDLSLKWLEKAKDLNTKINDSVSEYETILKQRIADKEKLDEILQ